MEEYKLSQASETQTPNNSETPPKKEKKNFSFNKSYLLVAVFIALIGVLVGLYIKNHRQNTNQSQNTSLNGPTPFKLNKPQVGSKGSTPSTSTQPVKTYNLAPITYTGVTGSISQRNVTKLNGYYMSTVHVVDLFSNVNVTLPSNQADVLVAASLDGASSPWTWQIPANELAGWQSGPYGQYFTGNDLVGTSTNGYVVSIIFDSNGQITSVFIAPVPTLDSSSGNNGSPGSSNNGQPQPLTTGVNGGD